MPTHSVPQTGHCMCQAAVQCSAPTHRLSSLVLHRSTQPKHHTASALCLPPLLSSLTHPQSQVSPPCAARTCQHAASGVTPPARMCAHSSSTCSHRRRCSQARSISQYTKAVGCWENWRARREGEGRGGEGRGREGGRSSGTRQGEV